ALAALLAAAALPDARARGAAMRALGPCSSEPSVIDVLQRGLTDPDAWVRYYACQSLGKLAWEPAAASIAALLGDQARQIRAGAREEVSHLQSHRAVDVGGPSHLQSEVAFEALREAAGSSEPDMQRAALVGLGIGGHPEALPIL